MLISNYIRMYAYARLEDKDVFESNLRCSGFNLVDRMFFFEKRVNSKIVRNRFLNLNVVVNLMVEGDVLVIPNFTCLGDNFNEMCDFLSLMREKKIRLICFDYSLTTIENNELDFLFFIYKSFFSMKGSFKEELKRRVEDVNKFCDENEVILMKFLNGSSLCSLSEEYMIGGKNIQKIIQRF